MKMEKVPWAVGRGWGCLGEGLVGSEEKGKGRRKNMLFGAGAWYTFIIAKTFARGRYSLIE